MLARDEPFRAKVPIQIGLRCLGQEGIFGKERAFQLNFPLDYASYKRQTEGAAEDGEGGHLQEHRGGGPQ